MKANYRAAASAGLLLSACANAGHAATTVQTTVGPHAAASNYDLLFSTPLTSVTQLVSISDGSVNTGEGAAMSISAILQDDSLVQLFATPLSPPFQNVTLLSRTGNVFTAFSGPETVKGLHFGSTGSQLATFTIPALTVLTFSVVPEPAAAIMMLLGVVFLAVFRRRISA